MRLMLLLFAWRSAGAIAFCEKRKSLAAQKKAALQRMRGKLAKRRRWAIARPDRP
jgi:hypothetical protein